MSARDFIFSDKLPPRIARHFLFWITLYVVLTVLTGSAFISGLTFENSLNVDELLRQVNVATFTHRLKATAIDLMVVIPYTYLTTYWLLPRLTKGNYGKFATWLILMTLIAHLIQLYELGLRFDTPKEEVFTLIWISLMVFVNMGPPVLCGLFITIKLTKMWYLKEEEKSTLIRENVNAELQLLKAQIHPHFLFNTLNNIYSFSLKQPSKAAALVSTLTDILKYMVNDCQEVLVPLAKEIKMVEDYVALERVRYGSRLHFEIEVSGDFQYKSITPLLLIPFIENSFKHGTSKMLVSPWLRLVIKATDDTLFFSLANSRPESVLKDDGKNGIGLKNVQKRLALLYPRQHTLKIESTDNSFIVEMLVPLHQRIKASERIKVNPSLVELQV